MTTEIPDLDEPCICLATPRENFMLYKDLGMDERYAETSLLVCSQCGRYWLLYHYELEAFSKSGRWYLGAITAEQASRMTARDAKSILERLSWYFFGGSYYGGRSGKASGPIS